MPKDNSSSNNKSPNIRDNLHHNLFTEGEEVSGITKAVEDMKG